MKPRSVTLDDVAAAAGVSYQTVSRVLNHSASVAEKTRLKVEAAMVALNYVPNRVAQQLAGKHSRTLGLATSDLARWPRRKWRRRFSSVPPRWVTDW